MGRSRRSGDCGDCPTVATVVNVRPVAGGLPDQSPALSISVVFLGMKPHPPCLLMVVRGLGGTDLAALLLSVCPRAAVAHHCQCVNGWMTDCSPKSFGVFGLDKALYKCRPFK
ncbi:hypothetical protein ILYODFUR_018274 [Ilyodon furcidens]|uniref:Uncharacterized protein n=1 Tax=Ilyodon furcidens TaxID=33524 RepID=A0ABV0UTD2_9TELE